MARKPKVSLSDAVSSAATDFINEAPDAVKPREVRDGSKVHTKNGDVRISLVVSQEMRTKLKILAANRQMTISDLIRRFLEDEIRKGAMGL